MAYRLTLDRLKHSVAALVNAQAARLGQAAESRASALEQRKRLKKLRALLGLATTGSNRAAVRRCDRALRDAGRTLGVARDIDALRETLIRLVKAETPDPALVRTLMTELDQTDPPTHQAETAINLDSVLAHLAAVDLKRLSLKSVLAGAGRSYRVARRTRHLALERATSDAAHDWRKTVQRHARHLQLLTDVWPTEMGLRVAVAKDIARLLGEEHDLHLFGVWLASRRLPRTQQPRASALLVAIDTRQRHLRQEAMVLGGKLFAERARQYRRRLAVYAQHQSVTKSALPIL